MFVGSETLAGDEALVCYLERGFSHGEFMIYMYHMEVLLHVYTHVYVCRWDRPGPASSSLEVIDMGFAARA